MELFSVFGRILLQDDGVEDKLTLLSKKAEETEGIFSGVFKRISADALQFASTLSDAFTKVVNEAVKSQNALTQMANIKKNTKDDSSFDMVAKLQGMNKGFSDMVKSVKDASDTVSKFETVFLELATAPKLLTGIKDSFKDIFGMDPKMLAIVAAITAIALIVNLVVKNWKPIKQFFTEIFSAIGNTFNKAAATIKGVLNKLASSVSSVINGIKNVIIKVFNGIKTGVMAILTPLIKEITNIFKRMQTGISTIMNGFKKYLSGIWLAIKTVILGPVLLVIDLVTGNFKKLSADAQLIFNNLKKAFSNIWNGIKAIFTGVVQAIAGFLSLEWNGIRNTASIIWNGFKNMIISIWNGILSFFKSIPQVFVNVVNGIKNTFMSVVNFFESLPSRFRSFMGGVGTAIINGFDSAINFIKSLPSRMLEWGEDMINGFIRGIRNMIGKVGDVIGSIGDKIRSFLHHSKPDEGPLADDDTWMPDFMTGLASGIEKNKNLVTNAVKGLASDVSVGMKLKPSIAGIGNISGKKAASNNPDSQNTEKPVQIVFNGNYCFMNKEMIDYFTAKVSNAFALNVQRGR